MAAARSVKNAGKRTIRKLFELAQRFGVDITPHHYYSDIPDMRELRRQTAWRKACTMCDVQGADPDEQLEFARACCSPHRARLEKSSVHAHAIAENGEAGYGPAEADFLYCFIRTHRPDRIVQIGCGVSTAVILLAAKEEGYTPSITCVEPYPTSYLLRLAESGAIRLLREKAQVVDLSELTGVGPNGLFFVDSTHTLRPGSEVNRAILEVLPRLDAGAWVHFHDIYFPYDYSPGILQQDLFFRHESILLHGYLVSNSRCAIACSLATLHDARQKELRALLASYNPAPMDQGLRTGEGDVPTAIYLQVKA